MRLRPRRLLWRVYLHGVIVLIVVAIGITSLALLVRDRAPWMKIPDRIATAVDGDLTEPERIQDRLDMYAAALFIELAIYDNSGRVVARAGEDPPHALGEGDPPAPLSARVDFRRGFRRMVAVPVDDGAAYVLVTHHRGSLGRFLGSVSGLLIFLAVLTIPLARAVTRPLEQLTATAAALGRGDLSARTGLERSDEIGDLARAMDEMASRLAGLLARERELLADISHELRTPMARIRVALELQAEEEGGLGPFLEGVEEDLAELEKLVSDVLTSARLDLTEGEAGFSMERETIELGQLARDGADRIRRRHAGRSVAVISDGPCEVTVDATLVRRVVENLLSNAVRYSEAGAPVEVEITSRPPTVEVRDRGVGLDPADLPRLFEPFFRADRSRARATGGVGLGLTLCKRIVEAHGGHIEAEPRDGGGAVFRFTLPG